MSEITGQRVIVTGAAGFIGGHLCALLVEQGAEVRALVRYNSRDDRGTLDWLEPATRSEIDVIAGDLRDVESVRQAIKGRDMVFHLAAQIAIPYSFVNPRDFFETNVVGSLNVAQAALEAGVARVIHTSTSEVYGTAQTVPITEDHPVHPQSPYAASKVGADALMDSFHRTYALPVTILRPFNTYGPHQSARAVIPTIISQALAGGPLRLGALDPRRDLTYVRDTAAGFVATATATASVGRTIQLGTGDEVSVGEIVAMVGEVLGRELEVQVDEARLRPNQSEVGRLISDPRLATELTGWRPQHSLHEGLAATIKWIEANPSRFRVGEYTI